MIPKLSVIIPVYNSEPYLQEAIDSIILQREFFNMFGIKNLNSTRSDEDAKNILVA